MSGSADKPHLLVHNTATPQSYTYPKKVRGAGKLKLPQRNRGTHGTTLLDELDVAAASLSQLQVERRAVGAAADGGMYLTFESEPQFDLALQSLDRQKTGIELVAVQQRADRTYATVLVPEGKLQTLTDLVAQYVYENDARSGRPKNRQFVESVSHIRRAVLENLWTDDLAVLPTPAAPVWWEVWLRAGGDPNVITEAFCDTANANGLRLGRGFLQFPDRTVVLAYGTREQLSSSVQLLDLVAELRRAKDAASFFCELPAREQGEWVDSFLVGLTAPRASAPAVCLLDTGVTAGHPLLRPGLADANVLSCDPAWGSHDHHGHGTQMAGLALLGDLTHALVRVAPTALEHCLESVKLLAPDHLHPGGGIADAEERKELFGNLTHEATGRIESAAPQRARAYCMTVTTDDSRDLGAPSSWSAKVDALSLGKEDGQQRLFVISAGNVKLEDWADYPDRNDIDQIHDPGQAWNALTVGAYTDLAVVDAAKYPGLKPIALPGALSPSSTTSMTWSSSWPNKPDIVLEGGNGVVDAHGRTDAIDELSLLTTHHRPTFKLLAATGDTSAAAAQAARMAAILMARYPQLWPESIRGLLVHSARRTAAMLSEAKKLQKGRRTDYLLRRYGYGVPDLNHASWSASNALTLIAQDEVKPYGKTKRRTIGTNDMNVHSLPWPRAQLEALFATDVELRVTLSYFIEPNPARRGWKYRHRYQSHGLRFALRNAGESMPTFLARVSKDAQSEDNGDPVFGEPGWHLGQKRNRGSIHSDTWTGLAQDLADRHDIVVFPVGGWWRERANLERWDESVRYSLIVTIRTPETEVDIYTPVATAVGIATEVAIGGPA